MRSLFKIRYVDKTSFYWDFSSNIFSQYVPLSDLSKRCESCKSNNNDEVIRIENEKLKKLVAFLKHELQSLELKTAVTEKAVPLEKVVKEFTSTQEGKKAWELAWKEQVEEWDKLLKSGKISRKKYKRLINVMDQAALNKK